MTKEQEKAIEKLRETQDSYLKDELDTSIEVVLNLLQQLEREKQAHIRIEQTYKKEYLDAKAEIEKKDKIIDEMSKQIHILCIQNIRFIRKWWENNICKNKACDENIMCEDCIKQYFERKAE